MSIKQALLEEIKKRQEVKDRKVFSFNDYCFPAQVDFFRGPGGRFRTACCSRRGGKTVGIAADMIDTCLSESDSTLLYITLTQQNARNIIWGDIQKIIEDYNIDCKTDLTRLTVTFPNRSKIVISGAKDRNEIEKYRGWKLKKCYIDEAQSFRPYLKELINDIITPALRDLKGSLLLTGTPGPVPAGIFYEYTHSDFWANYHWTAFDNPYMHNPPHLDLEQTLLEERTMKGIDETDPGYQRETYGIWIEDKESLVFRFSRDINTYEKLPEGQWFYIFGIDIGYNDADAIAVLGYNEEEKRSYLIEEKVVRKQDITSLINQIKVLQAEYNPIKMVMDAGALGKKIQEEIIVRHGLNIEAAEKHRKMEFIALLNDDLRTGKFKAFKGSEFEEDCMLVQWDRENKYRNPEKPKISDTYHSDITDAVLYAWRECKHYLSERSKQNPTLNTEQYMIELEQKEAQKLHERKTNPNFDLEDQFDKDAEALQAMLDQDDFSF